MRCRRRIGQMRQDIFCRRVPCRKCGQRQCLDFCRVEAALRRHSAWRGGPAGGSATGTEALRPKVSTQAREGKDQSPSYVPSMNRDSIQVAQPTPGGVMTSVRPGGTGHLGDRARVLVLERLRRPCEGRMRRNLRRSPNRASRLAPRPPNPRKGL